MDINYINKRYYTRFGGVIIFKKASGRGLVELHILLIKASVQALVEIYY